MCPNCGSERVYRSHRLHAIESLRSLFGFHPHRCEECGHRYFARAPRPELTATDRRKLKESCEYRRRRNFHELMAYLLGLLFLLMSLRWLAHD